MLCGILAPSFVAQRIRQQLRLQGLDVQPLPPAHTLFTLGRLPDELRGAVASTRRASQSPVRHGVIGLELQAPAERALRLVKPERMKEGVALVEPVLDLGILRCNRKMSLTDPRHGPGFLARASIKRFAVERVALFVGCRQRSLGRSRRLSRNAGRQHNKYKY